MLKILSNIYGYFADNRNAKFDCGKIPIHQCKIPVISIGNISAGGTGKTPLTLLIAKFLLNNGIKPGIIARGYKGDFEGSLIVSDGNSILSTVEQSGDEMYMLANNIKVPIMVNKSKYKAAIDIEQQFDIDCIIVDDGFQHRYLHRDLDIIIVDKQTLDKPYPLPKGRLREPVHNINRAEIICLPEAINDSIPMLQRYNNRAIYATLQTKVDSLIPLTEIKTTDSKVFIFSGIANHSKFRNSLIESGNYIIGELAFPDHYNYTEASIRKIILKSKALNTNTIITTEKDAVKLSKYFDLFSENNIALLYLKITSIVSRNEDLFCKKIIEIVNKK